MENIQPVGYGPVIIMWRHSSVTDHRVVVKKLQAVFPEGTQVFGVQERCDDADGCYIYQMVVWPSELEGDDPTKESLAPTEWRSCLQEVVAELGEITELLPKGSKSGSGHTQSMWEIECCGDGVDPAQFVMTFVQKEHSSKQLEEREGEIVFGEIAFEYEAHGQRWREKHFGTAEGGYFGFRQSVDGP